jgi:peptide/nickel transport system substrate-binding protein
MRPSPGEETRRSATRFPRRSRALAVGAAAVVLALAAAGCTGSTSSGSGAATITRIRGGTAVWAEPPATTPNYIFPFESSAYISFINSSDFAQLMYRPLYWFGSGSTPLLNTSLSLAKLPTWSRHTATITLKHYMWSDGTPVTATDVMFWLNMLKEVGATDWGAYNGFPGAFVSRMKVASPTELKITTNRAYNHQWFLDNDLSQITPMPPAWDRTASGPSDCAAKASDCAAVYSYLDAQSRALATYASSPLWGVVDGPWMLSAFTADGHVTFAPNPKYSGPVKPALSQFQEVPFTSSSAEYSVLRSPAAGGQKIDVGYLPAPGAPGGNALPGYTLAPLYLWGINYFVMNFQSTTGNGPVINQLYFRQALAYLLDQQAVITGPLHGYGIQTPGPVANTPLTPYISPQLKNGSPYPYSPAKAKSLLASHGWKVVPGSVSTCATPSLCGKGITAGHPLVFNLLYATGMGWITQEMQLLRSHASLAGIKINLQPRPFTQVTAVAATNCKVAHIPCHWDLANWGTGWSFAPDYLPTGETLFKCDAIANSGGYCNPLNDKMINETLTSGNLQALYNWENYLANELPVMFQPSSAYSMTEVVNNLKGVLPQSPTMSLNPENWYFVK